MQYTDTRYHLHVEFETENCDIPSDELTRMEESLEAVGIATEDFPGTSVHIKVIHHPKRGEYHVEGKLALPGQTLRTGSWDRYLDSAFQRTVRKLLSKAQTYREHPDEEAVAEAERRAQLTEVVPPAGRFAEPLSKAVEAHDYRAFRNRLSAFDDWLNRRAGRWVQRFPEAQGRVGRGLLISDLVEEVYLNAFEEYAHRPAHLPLHEWLESLLDPSLKMLMRNLEEETENARLSKL
jgi:hypothetical protein